MTWLQAIIDAFGVILIGVVGGVITLGALALVLTVFDPEGPMPWWARFLTIFTVVVLVIKGYN